MATHRDVMLSMQRALLGAIVPHVRAVAVGYNEKANRLIIRFYLDRDPNEEDQETASVVATEVIADFPNLHVVEECLCTSDSIGRVDALSGFAYVRKED